MQESIQMSTGTQKVNSKCGQWGPLSQAYTVWVWRLQQTGKQMAHLKGIAISLTVATQNEGLELLIFQENKNLDFYLS